MIIINDICGDEDDNYISCEILRTLLQKRIYESLLKLNPKNNGWVTYRHPGYLSYVSGTCEVVV